MKGKLDKKLLRESIRLMMEEEWQEVDDEIKKQPHTFSPQFYEKMKRLLQSVDTFAVHTETETDGENRKNRYSFTQQNKSDLGHISFRLHVRYIAVIVLLMVGVSAVALANDDIRKGLYQLQYQFFEDNVTIEATPENGMEKDDDNAASEEFHAYKWKEVPEGYEVVQEEDDAELRLYRIDYENSKSNFIHYMQNDASLYTTSITYDEEKGYKHKIRLRDDLEAYSISDGRRNTIFFLRNGYFFEFMSNQPEEVIIDYINFSEVLEYGN